MPRRKKPEGGPEITTTPLAPPTAGPATETRVATSEGGPDLSPPTPAKPRRPRQTKVINLKKELKQIYSTEEGSPLDMSFFERKASRGKAKKLFLTLLLVALLTSLSWLGFFIFAPGQRFSEESIKLTVEVPEALSPGAMTTIKIHYANEQKTPLAEAYLTVRYPRGFTVRQVAPAASNKDQTEWNLGTLTQNNAGVITLTGTITGAKEEALPLRIFLNYKPANFNAEFQKIITQDLRLAALPLEAAFVGPDELETGKTGQYDITYKNSGTTALDNLVIKVGWPLGFKTDQVEPEPNGASQKTADQEIISFAPPSLQPGAELKIKISGAFGSQTVGGEKNFTSQVLLKTNDQLLDQGTISKKTTLTAATIKLDLTANGTTDKRSINFENKLKFVISFANTGQLALKNAVLRLVLDTPSVEGKSLLNWPLIEDANRGAVDGSQVSPTTRTGTVSWTKQEIKNLAEIKPGDQGEITVIIPVKAKKDFAVSHLTNWHVKAYAQLMTTDERNGGQTLQSNALDLVLNTDLALVTAATVKETANQAATYLVNWTLTNTLHEITDVILTTKLPENVNWGGLVSVSAGDLSFDKETRQVTWVINRIPVSFPKTQISFAVGLKRPSTESALTLTDQTNIQAKDKVTGESLLISKEPLTVQ